MFFSIQKIKNLKTNLRIGLVLSGLLISIHSNAQFPNTANYRNRPLSLTFTTSTQSIYASNCSGVMTVQTSTMSGSPKVVASNVTVNLSSTGTLVFYSDSSCTVAITSVVIGTGTSSNSFYFIDTASGTDTITATASGYLTATQNEIFSTNPFVWTGGGGDANWNTNANWSGGSSPGAGNVAIFNSVCVSNCSPTINVNPNIQGVRMTTGFSGTLNQAAGISMTIGSSGWVQIAGTFAGGDSAITFSGPVVITGGTYTASSGIMYVNSKWAIVNSPTFNRNSGSIYFSSYIPLAPGTVQYNNVKFVAGCGGPNMNLNGASMNVQGMLYFDGTGCGGYAATYIDNGTFLAYGDVTSVQGGNSGGSGVTMMGNGSGQTVTGVSFGSVPNLNIQAGANTVNIVGSVQLSGNYTVSSVGTLSTAGSNINFYAGITGSLTPGAYNYNNVKFRSDCTAQVYNLNGGTLNVTGTLDLDGTGCGGSAAIINNGNVMAYGNIQAEGVGSVGSGTLTIAGNALGQTLSATGTPNLPSTVIATGANNLTVTGTISFSHDYTLTSVGTFTATGSTIIFGGYGYINIIPGTVAYDNVTFRSDCTYPDYNLNGGTINVGGNLVLNGTGCGGASFSLHGGSINASKNVASLGSGNSGNFPLQFVGSTDQTVSAVNPITITRGNITINTTAGAKVLLASAASFDNVGQSVSVTAGAIDMAGYALTTKALNLNSTTVTKNGGVLTVNGSIVGTGSLFGGTVAP